MTSKYVFGSHAVLALFQKEKGSEVIAGILRSALKQGLDRLICDEDEGYLAELESDVYSIKFVPIRGRI